MVAIVLNPTPPQPASAEEPEGQAGQPPAHEEIEILGDQDLIVPPPAGDDDGVRRGTGTADDPYVISNWTIQDTTDTRYAIHVRDTTRHLVIRDVAFDAYNQTTVPRIGLENVENVTVSNLALEGLDNASHRGSFSPMLIMGRASTATLYQDVQIHGRGDIALDGGTGVLLRDLSLMGWGASLPLSSGTYDVRNVRIDNGLTDGKSGGFNGQIRLSTSAARPDATCRLHAEQVEIAQSPGRGIEIEDGCEATVEGVEVETSEVGVHAKEDSRVRLREVTLQHIRDPNLYEQPEGGVDHNIAGILTDDARVTGRNVTVDGYWHGVSSRGGGFDLEDVRVQGHQIGIYASRMCEPCEIHDSSILGSRDMHVLNEGPSTVDARHNWWGSKEGPDPEMIDGPARVEPWRTEGPAPPSPPDDALPGVGAAGVVVAAVAVAGLRRPR